MEAEELELQLLPEVEASVEVVDTELAVEQVAVLPSWLDAYDVHPTQSE